MKRTFRSLGGKVTIRAGGAGAAAAIASAEKATQDLHRRLTRFEVDSELCLLNSDPRREVPSSPLMIRFAEAVRTAGELSNGLVDATLLEAIEDAGYTDSIDSDSATPVASMFDAIAETSCQPASGSRSRLWETVTVDHTTNTVRRPPGVKFDSGGIGKGLAADVVAELLDGLDYFAVECSGDLRFGSQTDQPRQILVASPIIGEDPIGELRMTGGAVATSGITKRSWINDDGRPAHHLIDPRTGKPAYTGVLQVTAVAPTAVEGEIRAKAALLAGPDEAPSWLVHGGVIVLQGNEVLTVGETASAVTA
ncbi:MAG: FAD:protein FMN transferase [Solirubrobacterales bacterium]